MSFELFNYHNVKQKKVAAHSHFQIQQPGQGTYASKFETVLSLNLTLCDKESRMTCFYIMLHKFT